VAVSPFFSGWKNTLLLVTSLHQITAGTEYIIFLGTKKLLLERRYFPFSFHGQKYDQYRLPNQNYGSRDVQHNVPVSGPGRNSCR
jgi:hypothetical protein